MLCDRLDKAETRLADMIAQKDNCGEKPQIVAKQQRERLRRALEHDDPDEALQAVKALTAQRRRLDEQFLQQADTYRTMILRKKGDERYKGALKELFRFHRVDEFDRPQYADISKFRFPLQQAESLRLQYAIRRRKKQIGHVPDRYLVVSKQAGEDFARMCGIACPETTYDLSLDQIPRKDRIVIKPMQGNGSKCVFVVNAPDDIWSVERHERLSSWEEMAADIRSDLDKGRIAEDRFEVQEAIYSNRATKEPVHDLKFYAFYGEIAAVGEIVRMPHKYTWWWTGEGEAIKTKDVIPDDAKSYGFTTEMLETARRLSLKIPAPFMRLDFLRAEDGIYFDEFCTFSGGSGATMLEWGYPQWDRRYGNAYLKAEMRIINDLLAGKRFDEINEFNRKMEADRTSM